MTLLIWFDEPLWKWKKTGGAWNTDVGGWCGKRRSSLFALRGVHVAPSPSTIGPSKRNKISAATGSTVIAKHILVMCPRGSRVHGESSMATGFADVVAICLKRKLKTLEFYLRQIIQINNCKFHRSFFNLICLFLQTIFLN